MRTISFFIAGVLLLSGFGCTNPLATTEKAATDIAMSAGTTMTLEETTAGLDNPLTKEDTTQVVLTSWSETAASLSWKRTEQRETAASEEARRVALSSPVGSGVRVPEVQYEEVTVEGTILGDGMENGTHLEVPVFWEEGEVDLSGEGNSLLWLSRGQYALLASTRHATVTFGKLDAFIANLVSLYENASNIVDKFQGNETSAPSETDVAALTTLTADPDWGSYEFTYAGEKIKVQTIVAENAFARFEILANPENPLVLSITPRPTSWVTIALETLHADTALEGYRVTQISPSSESQPQPEVQ